MMLAALQSVPSTLAPHGPGARSIAELAWFLIVVASVVSLIVAILVVVAAVRRRGTLATHESGGVKDGIAWIRLAGIAATSAVLAVTFFYATRTLGMFPVVSPAVAATPSDRPPARDGALVVDVTGQQWWWRMRYRAEDLGREFETANELHVPVGRPVRVRLVSRDVAHSFWIPQLHPKMDLIPGETNTVVFRADTAGEYRGECAEFCGQQHANMAFVVVAESPEAFDQWVALQRSAAPEPSGTLAQEGRQVFEQRACSFCHTVRGTRAAGNVAPDLTHLAGRETLGAGVLRNTRGNLEAWVLDAPARKPGTRMPRMTDFDGPSIRALVAYLETLK